MRLTVSQWGSQSQAPDKGAGPALSFTCGRDPALRGGGAGGVHTTAGPRAAGCTGSCLALPHRCRSCYWADVHGAAGSQHFVAVCYGVAFHTEARHRRAAAVAQVGSVEIERAVVEGVAAVAEAAAVGVPAPGGGPEQLLLFVVLRPRGTAGPPAAAGSILLEECRAAVRRELNPLFKVSVPLWLGKLGTSMCSEECYPYTSCRQAVPGLNTGHCASTGCQLVRCGGARPAVRSNPAG
jgi:hypothetical protein